MQRRNFLKGIFGVIAATAAASVPMFAKENRPDALREL